MPKEELGGFKNPKHYEDSIPRLIEVYTGDLESYWNSKRDDFWTSSGDGVTFSLTDEQLREFRDAIWNLAEKYDEEGNRQEGKGFRFHFVFIPEVGRAAVLESAPGQQHNATEQ